MPTEEVKGWFLQTIFYFVPKGIRCSWASTKTSKCCSVKDRAALTQAVAEYFAKRPDGMVVLKADRALPFRSIEEVLELLKDVGGDRVGLSFEQG